MVESKEKQPKNQTSNMHKQDVQNKPYTKPY